MAKRKKLVGEQASIINVIILVGLFALFVIYITDSNLRAEIVGMIGNANNIETTSTTTASITTITASTTTTTLQLENETAGYYELKLYALSIINDERAKRNLSSVALSDNNAAQEHAEDMIKYYYLSHWDSYGRKPYMQYTDNNGLYGMSQNAAWSGFFERTSFAKKVNPKASIEYLTNAMIYDDAGSDWGHRDNILNPTRTHVSLGIAYDDINFAFVQNFEDIYINWKKPITNEKGVISMSGSLTQQDLKPQQIAIFYDADPKPMNHSALLNTPHSYDAGNYVASVLPPGYIVLKGKRIAANEWSVSNSDFKISFDTKKMITNGTGVYTLHLQAADKNDTIYDLTDYSITIGSV
ncbi:MAG: CAP domain-containing protein [Candidatus Aenigmarchaeota archaeon]|nr:CAP domain-containing protein [Candidatus Aenigmarchaeota archaeon]